MRLFVTEHCLAHVRFINDGGDVYVPVRSALNRLFVLLDFIHLFADVFVVKMRRHIGLLQPFH